ncbi:DNA-binding MarR family transcriptional regulator [Mycolicibacterium mucogenicum 261Sha1.1M5]|uniref:DNA-binding MarR family transcriptional regulator n=1 Tax=Leucobacter aridicollis TaxID=283878 RepID=A0A852R2V4_9MICO|nr:MarR family transcriptional regulator [Leucobacter aridicollis]MBL3682527.1 MarR family transcriptional regulator [Leucobacter aridicollis]MCS3426636.1 DNA-binding MarR family transcriptional regulator [Leucobacter aridicollis]NYD25945.1 DNA-binding MarR family transcriptional regulator [Leucobacter aridicollis]RKQ89218.1 DNA-binding MarR family transcriptional regulator [Mycolicibacterium mucogenicum 261Sha1.1M5]
MQDMFADGAQERANVYDLDSNDPEGRLVSRAGVDPAQVQHIGMLMGALGRLRDAEQELSDASLKYMRLNETDMRALHFLIVAGNRGDLATPGTIASHLKISSASTTKLLDRLERAGHIVRRPHPTDRRALAISITPETHEAAMNTVGKQHAKRFHAAARLTPAEREVVIRFLDDMASEIRIGSDDWPSQDEAPAR